VSERLTNRVLLIVGQATGGMGRHVASLAAGLPDRGWRVGVFTSPLTVARLGLDGGDRRHGLYPEWTTSPHRLPRTFRALRAQLAAVDLVHAHGHQAGLLAVVVARTLPRRRRPVVIVSWHNAVLAAGPKRRLLALAERAQARGADLVTGASGDLVERARALGARAPELAEVAAGITAGDPPGGEADQLDQEAGPTVLTVSRIAPQKRLDVLVAAAARLADAVPGVSWLVAGDGDPALLAELEERRDAAAAPVTFLGPRSDVPALMAGADVFALPSAWEARALVVQEAMAAGLPVVATDVGGLPDLLAGTGLLVPPGDPEALAEAVARLLVDSDLAAGLARRARGRFAALPTEAQVVDWWAERYRALTQLTRPE
jgi:glycosyltransferase involved in cell wall biosynthesis